MGKSTKFIRQTIPATRNSHHKTSLKYQSKTGRDANLRRSQKNKSTAQSGGKAISSHITKQN